MSRRMRDLMNPNPTPGNRCGFYFDAKATACSGSSVCLRNIHEKRKLQSERRKRQQLPMMNDE